MLITAGAAIGMHVPALMYHAVLLDGVPNVECDPHYAVSAANFRNQMGHLRALGRRAVSVSDVLRDGAEFGATCVTFDDGGSTDADVATPILMENGQTADFFVNTGNVGKPGFVSWSGLSDMARAGMSIQSHGHTHRLLNELSGSEIFEELHRSRQELQDRLGLPVTLFAPPGGRLPSAAMRIAREVGYIRVCGSVPGVWSSSTEYVLPRLPVLATTTLEQFEGLAQGHAGTVGPMRRNYLLRGMAKRLLGNRIYERVRTGLLQQRA